jgi:hypothetical protein
MAATPRISPAKNSSRQHSNRARIPTTPQGREASARSSEHAANGSACLPPHIDARIQ